MTSPDAPRRIRLLDPNTSAGMTVRMLGVVSFAHALGPWGADARLVGLAAQVEAAHPWRQLRDAA